MVFDAFLSGIWSTETEGRLLSVHTLYLQATKAGYSVKPIVKATFLCWRNFETNFFCRAARMRTVLRFCQTGTATGTMSSMTWPAANLCPSCVNSPKTLSASCVNSPKNLTALCLGEPRPFIYFTLSYPPILYFTDRFWFTDFICTILCNKRSFNLINNFFGLWREISFTCGTQVL